MLLLKLACKNAFRHTLRSVLTILGITVAILAFGLLRTVIDAWHAGVEASAANRLVTRNAISLTFSLPLAYKEKIRALQGVTHVAQGNWFGGIYVDEKNFFANMAYDLTGLLALYPEFVLSPEERTALLRDRKGCLVGRKLAARFGWKTGDTISLRGTIYPGNWDMTIRAVYSGAYSNTDETLLFFHWAYLDEAMRRDMPDRAGKAGWYLVGIADPSRSAETSRAIDDQFANSLAETLTETEKAFNQGFVAMSEAILVAIRLVSFVVVLIILAVAANTMAMSARERTGEYAVLKTLGFGGATVGAVVVGESLTISLAGAGLGVALIGPCARAFSTFLTDFFPVFVVSGETVVWGLSAGLVVGLASAAYPAHLAVSLRIAQALRKVG